MRLKRVFLWMVLSLVPLLLVTGCGDLEPKNTFTLLPTDNTTTILAFGQSNSANWGDPSARIEYKHPYFTFIDKADGSGSSVWPRLAKLLINYDERKVVIVSVGIGGTNINFWANDNDKLLSSTLKSYNFTHIIFHQGEADAMNNIPKSDYESKFKTMITWIKEITGVPFYLSVASKCFNNSFYLGIQQAQIELANEIDGVFLGVNTNNFATDEHRYDSCHFNAKGLDRFASELFRLFE